MDSKYGDSNGFQAGSTFKLFVLAAALEQGLPTSHELQLTRRRCTSRSNEFPDCDGHYPATDVHEPAQLHRRAATSNMYKGTQLSVNTYFAQLERKTGLCEPYALAKSMGVDLTDPDRRAGPDLHPRRRRRQPAGDGRRLRDRRRAAASTATAHPVTQILNSDGKVFKNYPQALPAGDARSRPPTRINDILQGVMEPGGFGQALALDKQSAGKTGTINGNMAVWFDGYTPALATAAMVAGANQQGHRVTLNGQSRRRPLHRRRARLDRGRADVGAGDARRPGQAARRRRSPRRPVTSVTSTRSRSPTSTGMSTRQAAQVLAGAGF